MIRTLFASSAIALALGTSAFAAGHPQTIVEIAAGNPDFSTLVTAVTAAGLVETLSGEGPFTVFAPVNAAFAALPAGTVEGLLADIPALTGVLTYHVVPAAALSTDLAMGCNDIATVNGAMINVCRTDSAVTVNGANVVTADIAASNGVIHVIDAVILPPAN
jgi:uncharacterized surface protein with fasciclin (FAS1) repeats